MAHEHEAPPRVAALIAAMCLDNVAALHGRPLQPDPHPPRTSDIA
jgi:hypothetical protein